MEGLDSFDACLKNLYHEAGILAGVAVSLSESFEIEAERLRREDTVARLKAIYVAIAQALQWLRLAEDAARREDTKQNLARGVIGLVMGVILALTAKNQPASNLAGHAFDTDTHEKRPFGTVMVCVGPEGLPTDVRAISISELARESNRPEFEIIQKLREGGYLLFTQEAFSSLIDKLAIDIREGRLDLPVSSEKLLDLGTSAIQGILCVAGNKVSKK
jgi:hypothetical protein